MKVAIVILNWNGIDLLKRLLKDVVTRSSETGTVYLADNGSSDGSVEWVRDNIPEVEIIENGYNYGFAGGYNKALEGLSEEYFVLLNSDIEVTPNWLNPVVDYLDNNPDIAACQPKILNYSRRDHFEHAGAAGGFIDRYGYPFCRGRILDVLEKDKGQYDIHSDIFWASGACMFIRSKVWREMEGFDSDFFAHMEEIDLCWRIHNHNYRISFIPDSTVYHIGGGTLPYASASKLFYNFRNNLFLLHKNLPRRLFKRIIITRLVLDWIAAARFLLMLNFKAFWQVFRSHLAYYKSINTLNQKRKKLLARNVNYPKHLILNKSVVFNFYLRGKKLFNHNRPL